IEAHGFVIGGHNGPYYDKETPVRNTSHIASVLLYYYEQTKQEKYYNAILECGNFLLSKDARPYNYTFYCRLDENKDKSNGIIGQAWAIEGLISVYKATKEIKYLNLAQKIFLMI